MKMYSRRSVSSDPVRAGHYVLNSAQRRCSFIYGKVWRFERIIVRQLNKENNMNIRCVGVGSLSSTPYGKVKRKRAEIQESLRLEPRRIEFRRLRILAEAEQKLNNNLFAL